MRAHSCPSDQLAVMLVAVDVMRSGQRSLVFKNRRDREAPQNKTLLFPPSWSSTTAFATRVALLSQAKVKIQYAIHKHIPNLYVCYF